MDVMFVWYCEVWITEIDFCTSKDAHDMKKYYLQLAGAILE